MFSLRNRPRYEDDEEIQHREKHDVIRDYEEWFEEFEKEFRERLLPIINNHKNIQFEIVAKNQKERDSLAQNQLEWNKITDKIREILGEK